MGKLVISDKLKKIKPYIVDKASYNVRLDANESFISFPKELKEKLSKALVNVLYNRYPDPDAEEICELYGKYCAVDKCNIMAGNGSDELIQILINGFLCDGEAVLTLKPDFSMYKFYASLINAYVIEYDMGEELVFDREAFIKIAHDEEVKLIIFSNPNNPTGGIIGKEDILYIVENCSAMVIVDEAYYEFYGETVIDKVFEYENLAVLRTCSKSFGLAAVRLGFLIAGQLIIENARKVKPPFNVNSLTQAATSVILNNMDIVRENVEKIIEERNYLYKEFEKINLVVGNQRFRIYPTYSNFIYIRSTVAIEIYEKLKDKNIIIRCFGENLRINAGSREENDIIINALKEIFEVRM